jgi:hypothetical protein
MYDFIKDCLRKMLAFIFDFAEIKVVDFKGKPKLKTLKNEFIQALNRTYYRRHEKSFDNQYEYTGYHTNSNIDIPIKDFLSYEKNLGYLKYSKERGERTKNETFSDLNQYYPEVYEKILKLFEREGFNLEDLEKAFKK